MSNETTRQGAKRGHVGEALLEEEATPASQQTTRDEDAEAFLREAAEAAAAAALEAEALSDEIETQHAASEEVEAANVEAFARESEALQEGDEAVDPLDAAAADISPSVGAAAAEDEAEEGAEPVVAAQAGHAAVDAADEAEGHSPEAELPAAEDAASGGEAERPTARKLDADVEALRAEHALSEELPTPEEQLLAQDAERVDEDDDLQPAEIAEYEEELQGSFEKIAAKARRLDEEQARNVLHSILFVADRPLSVEQLRQATGLETRRVKEALERLGGELREGISGVVLSEVAGGWQLRTAPESADWIRRFLQVKPRRLTRAALETLAIVAYRQPVTRPEIEDIRGVDCGAVVKALLDWKLIKILGKKDEVGRPLLYGTSREFLEFFQLKDLASLPTLREFHELNEESRQIVEEELGPDAAASIAGTVAELSDPAYLEEEKERVAKSEQALAELEHALADAEAKASDVASAINPPKAEPEEPAVEGEEN